MINSPPSSRITLRKVRRCRKMMEAEDSFGTVDDKIMFLIKQDGEALEPDMDNDNDLHVCRKCNKVFQCLASYLEHKVKFENYNISETLSKLDQRIVQPHQMQETKKGEEVLDYERQNIAATLTQLEGSHSKSTSSVYVDSELIVNDSSEQSKICAEFEHKDNLTREPVPKSKDRKRKSVVQKAVSAPSDLEALYVCALCEKKFRREASLRWHMNFGHSEGKKRDKNPDLIAGEVTSGNRNTNSVIVKTEQDSRCFEEDKDINAVIRSSRRSGKLQAAEDLQVKDGSSSPRKKAAVKEVKNEDTERPHVCDICGRSFKKMAALKTHAAVHSDDRKFVCTFKDCPYGFKLKGGLVRHMRRHTGERPYVCENCGRAFSESGALTRHMKSRLNCARRPGSAYPHYMKNWTYHPNIPAVLDPSQRRLRQRRSKVFSSLLESSGHESKYDKNHNSPTRSHPDGHSTPQSMQTKLRQAKIKLAARSGRNKLETPTGQKGRKSRKSASSDCELPLDDAGSGKETEDLILDPPPKKRGRKRKSEGSKAEATRSDVEVTYVCTECSKKFRREATLRWHMKYEHADGKGKSKDSEEDITAGDFAGKDTDYIDVGRTDHHSEKDEYKSQQEIDVTIEQEENFEGTDSVQPGDVAGRLFKKSGTKCGRESKVENCGRPYICDICGQRFKKMAALKTHAAVHSDDRKFVCTFKDCPYGFKLKGSLVRHMRRHTGERPYVCENCGRAFSESGALTRHMKSRRNCARTPDSAYHRYMRNWTYHPDIPAVMDPFQRGVHQGQCSDWNLSLREANGTSDIVIEVGDKFVRSFDLVLAQQEAAAASATTQHVLDNHAGTDDTLPQEHAEFSLSHVADLTDITGGAEVQYLSLMQCCVCKKDFGTVEGLEIHLRSHLADQSANCSFCHFSSHDQEELRLHILSMHHGSLKDIEASVLSMTQEGEDSRSEAVQDKKTITRDALIAVKQLYTLRKHQESSDEVEKEKSTNGRLQCMVCNRFFALRSYLQQHMRTHIGDRPYKCHICHRSFTALDVLKKHMYVHKDQRDFKCGECGKLFKRLTYLQQHLKIHTQERTIQCSLCDKLFRTQYSLTVHMRTHSGINPYKCHVCSKHFRERGSLRRHMRLHAGEKPYKCPICNRAFAENGTLSRHLKAKIPCSNKQAKLSVASLEHNQDGLDYNQDGNSNLLTQFSAVVANTQQYIQHVDSGQSFCLPGMHEGQETETLHIFDTDINESVIIVAEKAIVELIREEQFSIEPQTYTLSRLTKPTEVMSNEGLE